MKQLANHPWKKKVEKTKPAPKRLSRKKIDKSASYLHNL